MISVVIPVKDGGEDLRRCLDAIRRQRVDEDFEVLVVDSGSRDESVQLARALGARVHEVPATAFNHGATRNLGARMARGEILVFISQDAHPEDDRWLGRLTAPLRADSRLAGVYGRQLPHDGAPPPEVYFLDFLYGPRERRQVAHDPHELSMETTLFSNANSAIRRSVWESMPFVEDIVMSEDQEWVGRALLAGWTIRYVPGAAVRHSHAYTIASAFRRFFDSGASAPRAYLAGAGPSRKVLRRQALRYALGEMHWLWRNGRRRWIPYAVVYDGAKFLGLQLGVRERHLPRALKRRLSLLPDYWEAPSNGHDPAVISRLGVRRSE